MARLTKKEKKMRQNSTTSVGTQTKDVAQVDVLDADTQQHKTPAKENQNKKKVHKKEKDIEIEEQNSKEKMDLNTDHIGEEEDDDEAENEINDKNDDGNKNKRDQESDGDHDTHIRPNFKKIKDKEAKRGKGEREGDGDTHVDLNNEQQLPPKNYIVKNDTKVLVFSTRGLPLRHRHIMEDLRLLLPHSKKEPKLDDKHQFMKLVPEVAELRSCTSVLFFESRKRQDLYMWICPNTGVGPENKRRKRLLSQDPQQHPADLDVDLDVHSGGPSVKFHVVNMHTMSELRFPGNCLKFSRPIVVFDQLFDSSPHWRVIKEALSVIFVSPRNNRKTKPFVDHVISFIICDEKIWMRHYQIAPTSEELEMQHLKGGKKTVLQNTVESEMVEIGPRLVLIPVRIFQGTMGGKTLFENDSYISPNEMRRAERLRKNAGRYAGRIAATEKTKKRKLDAGLDPDPVHSIFK